MAKSAAGPGLEVVDVSGRRDVPRAKEAERAVVSIAVQGREEGSVEAATAVAPDLILHEGLRTVYRAARRVADRGAVPDFTLVATELRNRDELEQVGGLAFLAEVSAFASTATQTPVYAEELREAHAWRELQEAVRQASRDCTGHGSPAEALARIRERLRAVRDGMPDSDSDGLFDLADVTTDPERLKLPEPLLPGIALPGYFSLYCGAPKAAGKTSFLAYGAGAVATGRRFLDRRVGTGRVLWVMGEGSVTYIGRYLAQVDIYPDPGSFVARRVDADPVGQLERTVEELEPDLVVIDSLGTWLAPTDVDLNAPDVGEPLRRVEHIARSGPAVVMIHHGRKSDGDPAGHHLVKAIPDAIRIVEQGESDRERVVKGMGRWGLSSIRYRLEELGDHQHVPDLKRVQFRRVDPERDMEERILEFLDANRGASKSAILEGISGARRKQKVKALDSLKRHGVVRVEESGRAHEHYIAETPHGHGTATFSGGPGHDGTGNGGDNVAERPRASKGSGDTATVAEPVDDEDDAEAAEAS